ncbi:YciI family protein [Henriciella aquimarina]|uniref:YciI family protein n=1 Tax=Henriciella aquimarina TaxID=545261 RepID=UPI000A05EA80|nr:YciI family protein [Henriciella aquimarina]
MPLFLVNARDKANSLDLRMSVRPTHLEWAAEHAHKVRAGGPVFAEDGETFIGSTSIVEFDSLQDAKDWFASDPYVKADLFESVEIVPFKWSFGEGKPE